MKELFPYLFQGFLILGIGVIWALSPKTPKLAVVNMNALISVGSQSLAKSGQTSSLELQEWGNRLKKRLEVYEQERQLILLAKGAVVGSSLPDMTEEVLGIFEEGEKKWEQ